MTIRYYSNAGTVPCAGPKKMSIHLLFAEYLPNICRTICFRAGTFLSSDNG